jgi:hypothetical protein
MTMNMTISFRLPKVQLGESGCMSVNLGVAPPDAEHTPDLFPFLSGFKRLCYSPCVFWHDLANSLCVFWLDLANTIGSLVSPKNCACGMAIFRPIVFYGVRIAA